VKDNGLDDNTIIAFSTDNGAENFTWPDGGQTPFAGGKGTALEGGFRVPAIIRWLPGSLEMAVADIDNLFRVEIPVMGEWRFTRDDAGRIHQPILAIVGGESALVFLEIQELVQSWFPHAKPVIIPGTNHMLQAVEPRGLAEVLASFWKKAPMR
jgi:pimeloyl-ACP methyl ester carboxylesterase